MTRRSTATADDFCDRPASPTRRRALLALFFAGAAALLFKLGLVTISFLRPPKKADAYGGVVTAGPVHELPSAGSPPLHIPRGRFWLVHEEQGITAVHSSCTHLECLFSWDAEKEVFVCPCHGSEFDRRGTVLRGPASRDLDRFPMQLVDGQGQVVAQSPPESAAPLPITDFMPAVGSEAQDAAAEGEPQEQVLITLHVDTSAKIVGTERPLN